MRKIIKWWKLSSGESCQVMKVIKWGKLTSDASYLVMKVTLWWKLKKLKLPKTFRLWWCFYEDDEWWRMHVSNIFAHWWRWRMAIKDDKGCLFQPANRMCPLPEGGWCPPARISSIIIIITINIVTLIYYNQGLRGLWPLDPCPNCAQLRSGIYRL